MTHPPSGAARLGWASHAAPRLTQAALDLDFTAMTGILRASIAAHGVVPSWEHLVRPAWAALGREPQGFVAECFFSRSISEVLTATRLLCVDEPARVLLAGADEEQHTLPLEALAAALAESGTSCCLLGARVPPDALARAAGRLRPDVVVIWSQTGDTADPAQTNALLSTLRPPTVVAAGPGWHGAALPPLVARPLDLATAVKLTAAVLDDGVSGRGPQTAMDGVSGRGPQTAMDRVAAPPSPGR